MNTANPPPAIELMSYPITHNPIKVKLLLNLLQQTPELQARVAAIKQHTVLLDQLQHQTDEFKAVNPNQKVPTLVHGDITLWESNAILQYLAGEFGSSLWPTDHRQQADVLRWMFWESNRWNRILGPLLLHQVYFPFWGYPGDQEKINQQRPKFDKAALMLDQHLQQQVFLACNALTIADLAVAAPLLHADRLALTISNYPALDRWLSHMKEQVWWQQTVLDVDSFYEDHSA